MNIRARRIGLIGLAIVAIAGALYPMRRMLLMSAPACMSGDWRHCLGNENGVVLMTLVGLPVAGLVVCALAVGRRAAGVSSPWRKSLAEVGIVYGTVPFLWLTVIPGSRAGLVPGRVNLIPFYDLVGMGLLGIAGNLLVFASLGFFGPMRFAALASLPRIVALAAGCSLVVEVAQYVLQLDRVSSVDDILVNAAGAGLAALASRRWWARPEPVPSGLVMSGTAENP